MLRRELERRRDQMIDGRAVDVQHRVGRQQVEEIVAVGAALTQLERDVERVPLIASCAVSRPTPALTAAIKTLVVARNGR